jgi:hypothetical protein
MDVKSEIQRVSAKLVGSVQCLFPLSHTERAFTIEISGHSPRQASSFRFGSIEVDPVDIVATGNNNGGKQALWLT